MADGDGGGGGGAGKVVLIVCLVLVGLLLLCCGGVWAAGDSIGQFIRDELIDAVPGSGVATTETRDVEPFTRVEMVGSADATITIGSPQSVTVTGDDNLVPLITTEVIDGELVISHLDAYSTSIGISVEITVPALDGIATVGAGDLSASGVSAQSFDVSIIGAGDVTVAGTTDTLDVSISGVGDAYLFDLVARSVTATISGTGDLDVHTTESLQATISGLGDIRYRGDPANVSSNVSGLGEVGPE